MSGRRADHPGLPDPLAACRYAQQHDIDMPEFVNWR
jgi:hypothetical protein